MKSTALLLSRDAISLVVFRRALGDVGFDVEVSTGVTNAGGTLESPDVKAIVVDCDDLDGGREFLSRAARTRSRDAIIIALTNHQTTMHEAFNLGATFVLQKPLNTERVERCMRATGELIEPQSRPN